MNEAPVWYCGYGQQREGPFAADALRAMVGTGRLTRETLVWREGMANWAPAGSEAELAGVFGAPPVVAGALQRPRMGAEQDSGFASLVPYRNGQALAGYYCGIFSLVPVFGLVLGPVAMVLGVLGLKAAARDPGARGKAHAWVAIVIGSITTLGHVGFLVLVAISMARR